MNVQVSFRAVSCQAPVSGGAKHAECLEARLSVGKPPVHVTGIAESWRDVPSPAATAEPWHHFIRHETTYTHDSTYGVHREVHVI